MNDDSKPQEGEAASAATRDRRAGDVEDAAQVDAPAKAGAAGGPEAAAATEPPDEGEPHEHYEDHRPSLAARALQALVILLIGGAGALWLAPKVAPSLPAPVAELLTPPSAVTQADLEALREELAMGLDGAPARGSAVDGGALEDAVAPLREAIAALEAGDGGALAARLAATEAMLAELAAQVEAASGPSTSAAEVVRMEAVVSIVEQLKVELRAAAARMEELAARMDAAEAASAAAAAQAEAARRDAAAAEAEAARATRATQLDEGFETLEAAMASGEPFGEALGPLEALGAPAPAPLAEAAATGLPTRKALTTGLIDASREGLAAWKAETSTGMFGRALAGLSATLLGVPTEATGGEGPEAALGLAAERMADGDVAGALAAAETLPEPVAAAMEDWKLEARRTADAEAAARNWRAALEAQDG